MPHNGMNRTDLYDILRKYGGAVVPIRRTGEHSISHPCMAKKVRVNGRRKDASRQAVQFVREAIRRSTRFSHMDRASNDREDAS